LTLAVENYDTAILKVALQRQAIQNLGSIMRLVSVSLSMVNTDGRPWPPL